MYTFWWVQHMHTPMNAIITIKVINISITSKRCVPFPKCVLRILNMKSTLSFYFKFLSVEHQIINYNYRLYRPLEYIYV